MDTKELEALNLLHCSPIDENGGMLGPPFPVVHNHLLCLDHVEGEVAILAPHGQVSDLLPIGCLIVVVIRPTTVVSSANLMMVLESCRRAVMSEQGVQEGTEHAPLRGVKSKELRGQICKEPGVKSPCIATTSLGSNFVGLPLFFSFSW